MTDKPVAKTPDDVREALAKWLYASSIPIDYDINLYADLPKLDKDCYMEIVDGVERIIKPLIEAAKKEGAVNNHNEWLDILSRCTCRQCTDNTTCKYAFDWYNVGGDCMAEH